ncbi:FecCD family ABC transporter permease [Microbacterium saperdae]|uniref:Iron complex transport system permease protein n=1 Tax=Microbacterium saperdae TaxID=69368 RepID=A0A543BL34_9MICO|nr:iron chelate uptake ABC transporter family permease subunit [Microbacterium saperdae]TQL85524.1 iron complex transport system permease protein [Microbacterium saperdae]GGM63154.1 iron ABC transporter permease [Microbacterium saperdae]
MRRPLIVAATALIVVLLAGASLCIGAGKAGPVDVLPALFAFDGSAAHVIVAELRLPRTLVAILAGCAFGVAGCIAQAVTRNPLGDPGVLGVNAGAAFAVAVAITVAGTAAPASFVWWALLGAGVLMTIVFLIGTAGAQGTAVVRLTLTGVALGAVLSGATTALTIVFPTAFARLRDWNTGSIATTDLSAVTVTAPLVAAGLLVALFSLRGLGMLSSGDTTAVSLGVNVRRTNALAILAVAVLAGAATAAAGPILFFGLVVAHIARRLVGPSLGGSVAGAIVIGPAIFLAADILARVVLPSGEVPVGLVTAAIGAPLLIVLARRMIGVPR